MSRRRLYLWLLAGCIILLMTLTSIPNPRIAPAFPGADKVAHFAFYSVAGFLCALWRREAGRDARRAVMFAFGLVLLLGAFDEVHQHWIPGRSMDILDWLADIAGGSAGALLSVSAVSLVPSLLSAENQSAPNAIPR